MIFSCQDRREVEAEAVDLHLGHPVAQAIHYHLQHTRAGKIDGVAGARVVDVVTLVVGQQTVIRSVIDALERQCRAELVPLRRVVIHHVENHAEAMRVIAVDHALELADVGLGEVTRVSSEETDRVVTPVVGQAFFEQVTVVEKSLDRHELDRGYAK